MEINGLQIILYIIHTVTIDTMLTGKHCPIYNGLKTATCKHSFNASLILCTRAFEGVFNVPTLA